MLDKLALSSSTPLNLETACQLLKDLYTDYTITGTKYHHSVGVFYQGSKQFLALHMEPRFCSTSPLKIVINPSQYKSMNEVSGVVSRLSPLEELKITRIDHTVDVSGLSVQEINSSLILTRKKYREKFSDGHTLETIYLGKHPEVLLIYNKTPPGSLILRTRIELQQHGSKVPIKDFLRLADYQSFNPFSNLKFKQVKEASYSSLRDQQKQQILRELFNDVGAQSTFKKFNRHSNFKRDFEQFLETKSNIPDLNHIYHSNLAGFFKEDQSDEFRKAN